MFANLPLCVLGSDIFLDILCFFRKVINSLSHKWFKETPDLFLVLSHSGDQLGSYENDLITSISNENTVCSKNHLAVVMADYKQKLPMMNRIVSKHNLFCIDKINFICVPFLMKFYSFGQDLVIVDIHIYNYH